MGTSFQGHVTASTSSPIAGEQHAPKQPTAFLITTCPDNVYFQFNKTCPSIAVQIDYVHSNTKSMSIAKNTLFHLIFSFQGIRVMKIILKKEMTTILFIVGGNEKLETN